MSCRIHAPARCYFIFVCCNYHESLDYLWNQTCDIETYVRITLPGDLSLHTCNVTWKHEQSGIISRMTDATVAPSIAISRET